MTNEKTWITLSEALSWIAFGQCLEQSQLLTKLTYKNNGSSNDKDALLKAIGSFADKAHQGDIDVQGKCVATAKRDGNGAMTEVIPAIKFADFRAFDIVTGGLGMGKEYLPWLSGSDFLRNQSVLKAKEHYIDVKVNFEQLKLELKSKKTLRTPLAARALSDWWESLNEDEKALSEAKHSELLEKAFPDHSVTRQRLRHVRADLPRSRGRAKIAKN